jgi:hypothetical protein
MKKFLNIINLSLFSIFILLSGCNVADNINKDLLGIEDEDNSNPPPSNSDDSQPDDSSDDDNSNPPPSNNDNNQPDDSSDDSNITSNGDSNLSSGSNDNDTQETPMECESGYHLEGDTCVVDTVTCDDDQILQNGECVDVTTTCSTGYHLSGGTCVPDSSGGLDYVEVVEFNLSLPEYNNQKSIDIIMPKNHEKVVIVRSNPKQTDINLKMQLHQFTNNSVVDAMLQAEGSPIVAQNYDYGVIFTSGDAIGKDEFQLTLENDTGFSDSVYINMQVIDQITLTKARDKYTVVTDGDAVNIVIGGYNALNNPLEFEIVDLTQINNEKNLAIVVNGSRIFNTDTVDGVDFNFSVRGLEDWKESVEIKVKDRSTGTTESLFLTIESAKRSTAIYEDLEECNEDYNRNYFEATSDSNTPQSPDGIYSSDNAIYLKSTYNMDYDIGNTFSTVMVFHPTNGQYSYDSYARETISNLDTGKRIATIYYANYLQGMDYFVKYYNEDKNQVVCERRTFPVISAAPIEDWESGLYTPTESEIPSIF